MVLFKHINLLKKMKEKMASLGDVKPVEEKVVDPSDMEEKIKKVEEELSMSKDDLKKKLEAESNEVVETGPKDEDDDTCEILKASTQYRED